MRKRLAQFRKLGRTPEHKWAMLRNMVTSLIKYDRIETTLPKAKELRHLADEVIGYAKRGGGRNDVYGRQLASRVVREKPAIERLFEVLGPRYADRDGGYTRVMKLSRPREGGQRPHGRHRVRRSAGGDTRHEGAEDEEGAVPLPVGEVLEGAGSPRSPPC
ncbi:hypothetical protein ACHAW5_009195 [Stephanodiscus triporus]|uniref:50S ribosomal protein L17 n=1 Tax=Stephanodiscus triporus TaxID=2934178 RepID=A0ABD3N0V3_9STRA